MKQKPFSKFGQEYVSFSASHLSVTSRWIHILAGPSLTCSLIALLNMIPFALTLGSHTLNVGEVAMCGILVYYASLSPIFTAGLILIGTGVAIVWQQIFKGMDHESYVNWVIILHVLSWVAVYGIGHGVFEKRKPHIFRNLIDSLAGPLFNVVNLCEFLGIRSAEMRQWRAQIDKNAEDLRKKDKCQ